ASAAGGGGVMPTNNAYRSARRLRRSLSPPEVLLWARLRGVKPRIRRQHPIGPYVADFYCAAVKHVFEIDGQQHDTADRAERDLERQSWLEAQGLTVIRILARDVMSNPDQVANSIFQMCQTPPPSPLSR
ncbi:MAG TPA: endonuclease domain-containing protein, partial [Sphingomicrobium sp.]|nr:endonuclease domain-containing protein [Sphingomicrobium sp.]